MRMVKMPRTVSMTHLERALDEVEQMGRMNREERKQIMELKKYIKDQMRKAQRRKG